MSSRGFKFNFSEGERVLCYEPDPNKAKVLYDSKILECCVRKDNARGKKTAEYLVHFYGWNSSWDRHVAEQNILKDNPENRVLQRQLAEIAAEPLKGKKLKLNKIPAIIKEVVFGQPSNSTHNSNDGNSKDSNSVERGKEDLNSNDTDDNNIFNTNSDNNSESMVSDNSQFDDKPLLLPTFMQLPEELKSMLEEDSQFIESGQLYSLPGKFTVKVILDKYIEDNNSLNGSNTSCSMSTRNRKSSANKEARQIMKEFGASLEKYFDTILPEYLLYSEEKSHHKNLVKTHPKVPFSQIYSFIYLLRMLTILPEFFTATPGITKNQISVLLKLFQEFIAFLNKNRIQFKG